MKQPRPEDAGCEALARLRSSTGADGRSIVCSCGLKSSFQPPNSIEALNCALPHPDPARLLGALLEPRPRRLLVPRELTPRKSCQLEWRRISHHTKKKRSSPRSAYPGCSLRQRRPSRTRPPRGRGGAPWLPCVHCLRPSCIELKRRGLDEPSERLARLLPTRDLMR